MHTCHSVMVMMHTDRPNMSAAVVSQILINLSFVQQPVWANNKKISIFHLSVLCEDNRL